MASITMDPPHVVNTGVACAACCNVAPFSLLRCGACDSAWYCNQDCQRKHFKEHKPFCRALRLFHSLQKDLPTESWPRTAQEFYVQRANCQRILEPLLRRPLSRAELRAILGEAKCSVCMRTRAQLALSKTNVAAAATATAPGAAASVATQQRSPPAEASTGAAALGAAGEDAGGSRRGGEERSGDKSAAALQAANGANAAAATANNSNGGFSGAGTLSCCPICNWGWACGEHLQAYLAGPHGAVCMCYQQMNDSQLLTQRYLSATGRLPNYVPDKLRPLGQYGSGGGNGGGWEPVPAGWAAFRAWRPLPDFDSGMMGLLTKRMSQALTVIQALHHHYTPVQLAAQRHLEVHVLGASAFEVPADRIWEEILNLMPPYEPQTAAAATAAVAAVNGVGATNANGGAGERGGAAKASNGGFGGGDGARVLHVAFVGPELRDIILEESDGRALPQGTALSVPSPPGRELLYSYHLCSYQEFSKGRRGLGGGGGGTGGGGSDQSFCTWQRPDIAVAFNSGISEYDQELWTPALEVLVRHNVPVVFTSYNGQEAAADAAVWRAAGGEVTLGPDWNPFRALEPISEPSQVDAFYYQNYYWWCGRGRAPQ